MWFGEVVNLFDLWNKMFLFELMVGEVIYNSIELKWDGGENNNSDGKRRFYYV